MDLFNEIFVNKISKYLFGVLILISLFVDGFSQSIGINSTGSVPNPAAILDVDVNNKGILLPRLTIAQRDAIGSPAIGLSIIKTDVIHFWNGANWQAINNSPVVAVNPAGTNTGSGVAINSGGAPANHSAILDVQGTTGGMLFPRMTTEQKNAINAVEGMLLFDITTAKFNFYNGSAWVELPSVLIGTTTGNVTNTYNVAINETASTADPSSILDIASTTKGFLLPRLTNAQRDAILSPAAGLMIYNTDTKSINVFNGSAYWKESNGATSGHATLTTSAATNITESTANSGGSISANGGTDILTRGICWNTSGNPTIADNKTSDGSGDGDFTSTLTGLAVTTTYYVRAYATNNSGTAYGDQISFTTSAVLPTLAATTAANSITGTTASSGGNVTNDGGAAVTARGVCWATSSNPTIANSKTSDGTGTGSFTSSLTGLSVATTYYVRAYATNSAGTAYGSEISFTTSSVGPTLAATTTVSSITSTTASSGGNVTSDGGAAVTARGVCWATSSNPTTANSKTSDGTGTGSFTSSITGLTAGTTYYVRAYATNTAGTSYGTQVSFTTLAPPTLAATTAASSITSTTASSGGNVTSDSGASVTARGVCWSTTSNPTTANSKTNDGTGTGSFISSITGLTAGTLYYVRAYATNSIGTTYGAQISFTTLAAPTLAATTAASSITSTTASSGGNVTSDGGASVTVRGVCWATTSNPTTANSKTNDGTGTGSFISSITGLTAGTLYYVRAYATNSIGTTYGAQISFTTLAAPTLAATTAASSITSTTASSGGNVTSDGGASVTARGVCWSTSSNPTTANSKTSNGTGIGSFTSSITGLTTGTTYYVRAYATNSVGTTYGTQISFTTLSLASLTSNAITNLTETTATGGGNITSDGGASVTVRGVCWSTTSNPTTANSKTTNGTGTGSFTSSITGLIGGTTYYVRAYATNSVGTAYGNQVQFTTTVPAAPDQVPSLITNSVTNITASTATSGGTISDDGGATVTARGVCWSTNTNPTIADSKTSNGSGTGSFASSLTGLSAGTTYYVRAYATNSVGTNYGNQVSFTTSYQVGQSAGGGIVFYVDETGQHGLIASTSDQSTGIRWYGGTFKVTNAIGTALLTGDSNTNLIISSQGEVSSAAYTCYSLSLNSYSDWYLPSKDELNLMYTLRTTIGGFTTGVYWSSTEFGQYNAWYQSFGSGQADNGAAGGYIKSSTLRVRAIRSF